MSEGRDEDLSETAPGRGLAPLDGIRVLDFGRYIAGPVCAQLLGDMGAEVIRIERVDGAEDRSIVPLAGPDDGGALFVNVNRGKRGLTLNPTEPEGREVLRRLLQTADVVIANLPERALSAMGLDGPSVHAINPRIVLATVDAFGPGPWSDRLGFDGIGQVMSGMAHLTGTPEQPTRAAALWVDQLTAALTATGVMAALLRRERAGPQLPAAGGARVRASLLHSAIHAMAPAYTEESVTAPRRIASGNRGQTVGPTDICATRDGWVIVQVVGNPMFARFCTMIGQPQLLEDPRFASDALRGDNRDAICDIAAAWLADLTTDQALEAFQRHGLATAPVLSPTDVLSHPHVVQGAMVEPVEYPGMPTGVGPTPPVTLDGTAAPRGRAPLPGEHTDLILREVGYSADEIAELHERRIV